MLVILGVPISFEEFLQKKKLFFFFRETLNYILFKLFFNVSYKLAITFLAVK